MILLPVRSFIGSSGGNNTIDYENGTGSVDNHSDEISGPDVVSGEKLVIRKGRMVLRGIGKYRLEESDIPKDANSISLQGFDEVEIYGVDLSSDQGPEFYL